MPSPTTKTEVDTLFGLVASTARSPKKFSRIAYDWQHGELSRHSGPREWQAEILQVIGSHLQNPETRFTPLRIAVASGHGIGKSALISQIVNWGMSTCVDCRVVITANTENQLRTKTWPEVRKWLRLAINSDWFEPSATSIQSVDKEHAASWRADAVPWSAHNTEAFAGLHNEGKRIILIFDEASKIDDKVWEVAEGALTDADTEIIWIAFGNPTRNTGRFRECFRRFRHRWVTRQIDARDVEGTNHELHAQWVADYGEDSDFVKVRVRGLFPAMSMKQYISETDIDASYGKHVTEAQYSFAPVIIGVDPAWEGDDDFVIVKRQGLASWVLGVYPKNDNDIHMANIISRFEDEHKADAVFVDGGYGTGIVSAGKTMGRNWRLVWFSESAIDPGFLNKRAEMWGLMKEWLKQGGAIPPSQELRDELASPETVPRLDGKIQLESKIDMKQRELPSPNRADALALTFAFPVQKKIHNPLGSGNRNAAVIDYDPFR